MDASLVTGIFVGLVIGLVAGAGGAWAWSRFAGGANSGDAKREAAFREEVADHFVTTAELVNRLTDSYKEVFDHLRQGAESLVDEETLRKRLAEEENKDVTLHLIGYRESEDDRPDPGGSASGKSRGM